MRRVDRVRREAGALPAPRSRCRGADLPCCDAWWWSTRPPSDATASPAVLHLGGPGDPRWDASPRGTADLDHALRCDVLEACCAGAAGSR